MQLGLTFCSTGFRADTETTLLLSAAFLSTLPAPPALWYPTGGMGEFCSVSGTRQQFAQAFSLLSPSTVPPTPLLSSKRSIIQHWGGGVLCAGGRDFEARRASLKRWHHLCRPRRLAARSPGAHQSVSLCCLLPAGDREEAQSVPLSSQCDSGAGRPTISTQSLPEPGLIMRTWQEVDLVESEDAPLICNICKLSGLIWKIYFIL